MTLLLFLLLSGSGEIGMSHFFYRNYAQNDLSYRFFENFGNFDYAYGIYYLGKEDFFIGRKIDEFGGEFSSRLRSQVLDSLSIAAEFSRRREVRGNPLWREKSGVIGFQGAGPRGFSGLGFRLEVIGKEYEWGNRRRNNSGVRGYISLESPKSLSYIKLKGGGERRNLTKRGEFTLEIGGFRSSNLRYSLYGGFLRNYFPHPEEIERSEEKRVGGRVDMSVEKLGFSERGQIDFELNDIELMRDFLHSRTVGRARVSADVEGKVFLNFKLSYNLEAHKKDFHGFKGDEFHFSNTLKLRIISEGRLGLYSLEYSIFLSRYSYPERVLLDDRDERREKVKFVFKRPLSRTVEFSTELNVERRDFVYVRSYRSASSRRTERYLLGFKVEERGKIAFFNKSEIAAYYTKFRFAPENNVLLRYLSENFHLAVPGDSSFLLLHLRFRTQDQGSYMRDRSGRWVYVRNQISDEIEANPSIHLKSLGDLKISLFYRFYRRYQKVAGFERRLRVSESSVGCNLEGAGFFVSVEQIWRRGVGRFYKLNLTYGTILNF